MIYECKTASVIAESNDREVITGRKLMFCSNTPIQNHWIGGFVIHNQEYKEYYRVSQVSRTLQEGRMTYYEASVFERLAEKPE